MLTTLGTKLFSRNINFSLFFYCCELAAIIAVIEYSAKYNLLVIIYPQPKISAGKQSIYLLLKHMIDAKNSIYLL